MGLAGVGGVAAARKTQLTISITRHRHCLSMQIRQAARYPAVSWKTVPSTPQLPPYLRLPSSHSRTRSIPAKFKGAKHVRLGKWPPQVRRTFWSFTSPDHPSAINESGESAVTVSSQRGLLVNSEGSADHEQAGSLPSRFANDGALP